MVYVIAGCTWVFLRLIINLTLPFKVIVSLILTDQRPVSDFTHAYCTVFILSWVWTGAEALAVGDETIIFFFILSSDSCQKFWHLHLLHSTAKRGAHIRHQVSEPIISDVESRVTIWWWGCSSHWFFVGGWQVKWKLFWGIGSAKVSVYTR